MILLIGTIVAGLAVWVGIAVGVAVVLGRMIARRDAQVASPEASASAGQPGLSRRPESVRSSADAVERSGS